MKFWSKLLVLAVAFGALCAVASAAATPITVTLHGPNSMVGGGAGMCPQVEQFTGNIHGSAGTAVTYRFERSTGEKETTHSATIPASGSKQVSDTWTVGKSGSYWNELHVLTPTSVASDKAPFQVNCPGGM
ncbi:MAG TPA: hypothetical protein VKF82_09575 [Candidatus Eremiobacteraceae bacterium]|nr:hypothetical protein [Candidatus Eremiobacteraceae bacterium]